MADNDSFRSRPKTGRCAVSSWLVLAAVTVTVMVTTAATTASAQFVADDFHACALDPAWTFVDPAGDGATAVIIGAFTDNARLALSVPGGATHEIWNATVGAPHVLQPLLDVDFTAEVKFISVLPAGFAQQGLFVRQDDSNWLRLEFYRTETGQLRIAAVGGPAIVFFDQPLTDPLPAPLLMRVVRAGDTWTVSWSVDGSAWQVAGVPFVHDLQPVGLGIYAGNRGANPPAHTVQVDWIRMASLGDDDTARNTLTTGIAGGGQVSRTPDLVNHACGQVVTVTALDTPGWTFAGWSGARTGTANPVEVTMSGPLALTATFVAVPVHTLAPVVIGGGSVILAPPGGSYNHGTVVSVTALDAPGWAFAAWTGALAGQANPQTLVMNADQAVTAAFSAVAQHTVVSSVLPVGAGTIVLNPAGSTYNEGSTVSAAAAPAPGWAFASWQGDLSGNVTPSTFVVGADRNIVAVFSQLPDRLLVTTVAGNGRVIRAPDVDYHPAGSQVALVAEPDPGFDFSGWSGDLAGSSSPDTILMDTDKEVLATYVAVQLVFVSDDFNRCELGDPWTVVDPYGDGGDAVLSGGYTGNSGVAISVLGGFEHEIWNGFIGATHILQPAPNADLTVEARFDSNLPANFGQQGIVIKESEGSWVRAEIFRDDAGLLRVAVDRGPNILTHDVYMPAGLVPPLWLRVTRAGDIFTQFWSEDGTNWTMAATPFPYAMTVESVGVFAGNRGIAPPAHTVLVDYFSTTAGPPPLEDTGLAPLSVIVEGTGTVDRLLDLPSYACGQVEQLTAVPQTGWHFAGWSGLATGTQNPVAVTMAGAGTVTARFVNHVADAPGLPLVPLVTLLHQCTPNPFNPQTVVAFDLAEAGAVRLQVYGIDGRLVRTLADGQLTAGRHERTWNGQDEDGRRVGSGVYLARLTTSAGSSMGRMVLLK